MASSNNLATIEPWLFKSTIPDSWYPDSFAKETESALTIALQQSFFNNQHQPNITPTIPQQTDYYSSTTVSTVTATASASGSEPETPGSKHSHSKLGVTIAKPNKRKPRASKRSMTTFIQADASNFRQMVQQVTGVKVEGTGQLPVSMVVKPEPVRQPFINKLQGLLPTLDTSAYLLQYQNKNNNITTTTNNNNIQRVTVSGSISNGSSEVPMVNHLTEEGGVGSDFYAFSGFPTLESSY